MTVTTDFNGIPFPRYPISNITPFTYRDGLTFLEMIEAFRTYINDIIVEGINENMLIMLQNYEKALEELVTAGEENIAAVTELFDTFTTEIQAIVDTINNKSGMIDVQHHTLTDVRTDITIRPEWPTNLPVYYHITQGALGNGTIVFADNIGGETWVNPSPHAETWLLLMPRGDGTWSASHIGVSESLTYRQVEGTHHHVIAAVALAQRLGVQRLNLGGTYTIGARVDLPSYFELVGIDGCTFTTTLDVRMLYGQGVTNVKVSGIEFIGDLRAGERAFQMEQIAIQFNDSAHIEISECTFTNLHRSGTWFNNVSQWRIVQNTFTRYGYSATTVNTGENGVFADNVMIGSGVYPLGYDFCYALAITHSSSTPRPRDVMVSNNRVENQCWEALDTHGGVNITFRNNHITNCEVGIVATPVIGAAGSTPLNIIIEGNVISSGTIPARQAISLAGSEVAGSERATGMIINNIVNGHGTGPLNPAYVEYISCAISLTRVEWGVVANNTVRGSVGSGIRFRIINDLVIRDNIISGIIPEGSVVNPIRAITTEGNNNRIYLTGNVYDGSGAGIYSQENGQTSFWGVDRNEWNGAPFVSLRNEGRNPPSATSSPAAFPNGTTHYRVDTPDGYPGGGVLTVHKYGNDRTIQELLRLGSVGNYYRAWEAGTSVWGPWYSVAKVVV